MKDMDYIKDRFKRLEDRMGLLESFMKFVFNLEHRKKIEGKDGSNRDKH